MAFITTMTTEPAAGNEFVPIITWAQTTLSETEKLEFDNVLAERAQWYASLKLDGTIIQYSDLCAPTYTVEWVNHPDNIATPEWRISFWGPMVLRWVTDTNQERVCEIIEKQ